MHATKQFYLLSSWGETLYDTIHLRRKVGREEVVERGRGKEGGGKREERERKEGGREGGGREGEDEV